MRHAVRASEPGVPHHTAAYRVRSASTPLVGLFIPTPCHTSGHDRARDLCVDRGWSFFSRWTTLNSRGLGGLHGQQPPDLLRERRVVARGGLWREEAVALPPIRIEADRLGIDPPRRFEPIERGIGAGAIAGVVVSLSASRFADSLVYGISPRDRATFSDAGSYWRASRSWPPHFRRGGRVRSIPR